jgi:hypothetical protein
LNLHTPLRRWQRFQSDQQTRRQIAAVERYLHDLGLPDKSAGPVLFFNASTRIHRVSLNAAFSLLAAWAVRAQRRTVRYLVCHRGMEQCILGTDRSSPMEPPPCRSCTRLSARLFPAELATPVQLRLPLVEPLRPVIEKLTLEELSHWTYGDLPVGQLVLPGLRWAFRRKRLEETESTLLIYRKYLLSAVSLVHEFRSALEQIRPDKVVVFNGIFYPEAVLRQIAEDQGIPVITHEVGLRPFSAFFSHREATFRELGTSSWRSLSSAENRELDAYLTRRFAGQFSMAGIRFWGNMQSLPERLAESIDRFGDAVSVFTNVVFDTSQIHANVLFEDMFAWLDGLLPVIDRHPETLFILRAHPDENRPGKESQESVTDWVEKQGLLSRANVQFIPPDEEVSSYQIIEHTRLTLVYNSSVGLEASILGKPVLCAGRARYTQSPTVLFPETSTEYWSRLEEILRDPGWTLPESYQAHARRFLHHELFDASLDLSAFLEEDPSLPGMVTLREFPVRELLDSPVLSTIVDGILHSKPFVL